MSKAPSLLNPSQDTHSLRVKIRAELAGIEIDLGGMKGVEIERRSKALTALFKLTQIIDEYDTQQAALSQLQHENTHTPYDKIPPPNDDEMRIIQDRLNSLYNRLRAAEDPKLADEGLAKERPDSP